VGFAWSLDSNHKTVIRSGFGAALAPPNLRQFSGLVYVSPEIPFRFRFSGGDITSLGLKYPMSNDQMVQVLKTRDVPKGYAVFDPDNRNPYSLQWSFDIQRQLPGTMVFETGYVGNKGLKIIASHLNNFPDRITGVRPFPQALESSWRNCSDFSYYHGWQSSLRRRSSRGLNFSINYTWGKVMALAAGDFWPGNDIRVQDEDNWRADKGPARFDIAHRVVAHYIYELPFARWLGVSGRTAQWLDGWQVSGTFGASTGEALNIEQRSNRDFSRPDYIGGSQYAPGDDRFQWLNLNAFAQVPVSRASGQPTRPGTIGKNSARSPGSWGVNLGVGKNIRFAERYRLQIRADMFGAFNSVNLGSPVADITRPTFGRILSVRGNRTMQLQARLTF